MTKKFKNWLAFFFLSFLAILLFVILYKYGTESAVLNPRGMIAEKERHLMAVATWLMLIVVIPVFLMTFFICLRYRASNKEAKYDPTWEHSALAETIWWGFPFIIIVILSIVTWKSSHELDPYKSLDSTVKPLKIQVIALDWKWLFIYPEQKIASVNFFQFPEKTPLNFEITADAPMNSFWIPQLGGQIYAMPGMSTELHLISDATGNFRGSSANLSGEGFAGMTFIAKASSQADFDQWVQSVKQSTNSLGADEYRLLLKPSKYNPQTFYTLKDDDLYYQTVMKYMMPGHATQPVVPTKQENPSLKHAPQDHN